MTGEKNGDKPSLYDAKKKNHATLIGVYKVVNQ
jgi:hypothetical protein